MRSTHTRRDERGVSLIELMVATLVIVAAAGGWMISVSTMAHTATRVSRAAELWSLGHTTAQQAVNAGCGLTVGTEAKLNDPTVVQQALKLRQELCGPPYSGSGAPQGGLGLYSFPVAASSSNNYVQGLLVSPVWSNPGAWEDTSASPVCTALVGQQPSQMAYQIYAGLNDHKLTYVGSFVHGLPPASELYHPAPGTAGGVIIALNDVPSSGQAKILYLLSHDWGLTFQVGSTTYNIYRMGGYHHGCIWFPLLTATGSGMDYLPSWTLIDQDTSGAGANTTITAYALYACGAQSNTSCGSTAGQVVAQVSNNTTGATSTGPCAAVAVGNSEAVYVYAPGAVPSDCPAPATA